MMHIEPVAHASGEPLFRATGVGAEPYAMRAFHYTRFILPVIRSVNNEGPKIALRAFASTISLNGKCIHSLARTAGYLSESRPTRPTERPPRRANCDP